MIAFKKLKVPVECDYGLITHRGGHYNIVFDAVSKKRILMRGRHRYGNTTIKGASTLVDNIETIEETIKAHGGVLSERFFGRKWVLETRGGPLEITIYDTWVAMRFEDIEKAKTLGLWNMNTYSGKWNFHMGYQKMIDADAYLTILELVL